MKYDIDYKADLKPGEVIETVKPNYLNWINPPNIDLNFIADQEIHIFSKIWTSIISFITSILFCRSCEDHLKCDGYIQCPWLSPHDEANCTQQCPSWLPIPCKCNKARNMTCEGKVMFSIKNIVSFLFLLFL